MKRAHIFTLSMVAGIFLSACGTSAGTSNSTPAASSTPATTSQQSSKDSEPAQSTAASSSAFPSDLYEFEDPTGAVPATGTYDFSTLGWRDRSAILAEIENYAMLNHTAGIPLYDDASYEVFSPRAFNGLPSKTYLTNYGWGVAHGNLDLAAEMANGHKIAETEAVEAYRPYFHSYNTVDSGTFNFWDNQGADVSERASMITSSYFGVKANPGNTSYYWYGSLCLDDEPIMLDADGNAITQHDDDATSQRWRVRVHTGEGYTYHTAPNSPYAKDFDGRQVQLDDYLTPFKALLRGNLVRTSELLTDSSGFFGAMDYYYASNKGKYTDWPSDLGIQLNYKENAIEFNFIQPKSASFARTALASGLYSPLPAEFLYKIGGDDFDKGAKNYGTGVFNPGDHTDAFDNVLFFGPYSPVYWENGKRMVYTKVDDYFEADQYNYPGYTEDVYAGSNSDKDLWEAFKAGKLDEVTLPASALDEKDAYAATTLRSEGSTIMKLNVNSTTVDEWKYFFGENGVVFPHAQGAEWPVNGIMSNENFLNGVFFSIDRAELAAAAGRNPALAYLSNAYMIDPSGNTSYRQSKWGKAVTEFWISEAGGDENAHSATVAQSCFNIAGRELIDNNIYFEGDTIDVTIYWRYQTTIDNLGSYIEKYIEDNFNTANKGRQLSVDVKNVVGGNTYTETYTLMDHGEFDFAEGAITGNVLNPLDFMSTISSNAALNQGFCLNWGHRTDVLLNEDIDPYGPEATVDHPYGHPICYQGKLWSYDALWSAAQGFTAVDLGVTTPVADDQKVERVGDNIVWSAAYSTIAVNDDGTSIYKFEPREVALLFGESSKIDDGFYCDKYTFDADKQGITGRISLTIPVSEVKKLANQYGGAKYFCIYFTLRYTVTLVDEHTGATNSISKSVLVQMTRALSDFGITLP